MKNPHYILVRISFDTITEEKQIEAWSAETGVGKRASKFHYSFKTEADLMFFKLKWHKNFG